MKNRVWISVLLASVALQVHSQEIFGEWWTPGFNARVLIYPCGEKACGKITWAWEDRPPDIADEKPLVGQIIFAGLQRKESAWEGRIYNPEDGRSYASEVGILTSSTLEVSGCVLMFCKRQVWRKFDSSRCPEVTP
ncbi:MAG TPA: DUF2147 domain-containing protein [Steroidobacteraceae bacterium]|nr:DUF2147 domain-containing protein [Steroidobacteraceae bacterium]